MLRNITYLELLKNERKIFGIHLLIKMKLLNLDHKNNYYKKEIKKLLKLNNKISVKFL